MKRSLWTILVVVTLPSASYAWWHAGHDLMTHAAVRATPEVPPFFKAGVGLIAHMAADPDLMRHRGLPGLRSAESGEHYIDLELLEGHAIPGTRYEYIALCRKLGVSPADVGFAPFAVFEHAERLTLSFAEYRKWPNNIFIQQKCLMLAGLLAHYAQDMSQPLHLTVKHHGYKDENGVLHQEDTHAKVDGLPLSLKMTLDQLNAIEAEPMDSLFVSILDQVQEAASLVDRVYELGLRMPTPPSSGDEVIDWERDEEVVAFAVERTRDAAQFTASLYLTAWRNSSQLELPSYLSRNFDEENR